MLSNHPRIRVALYVAALVSQIASFFVAIINIDLAGAFVSTSGVLSLAAGVTALTNITPPAAIIDYADAYVIPKPSPEAEERARHL